MKPQLNIITRQSKVKSTGRPPVLLVHGSWHGAWCWEGNFLEFFAENGFDTHALDLRGHGESPARKAMRWNRISDYVEDVLSTVEAFEQPPIVIGHSMGGFVCQHLLSKTKHLAGIGLLATAPHYGAIWAALHIARTRPLDFLKVNAKMSLYPLVSDPMVASHMFLDEDTADEDRHAFGVKMIDESYLGFLDMLFLNLPPKPNSDVPVCVIGAEKDKLFPPESQQSTARRYGAECHIIPDAPHDLMQSKHWEKSAQKLLDWIHSLD